jgi:hypothetical protein
VVVEIRQGRKQSVNGCAIRNNWQVRRGCYNHHIKVWLPQHRIDALAGAYVVSEVLMHEFAHVLDYEALDRGEHRVFDYYRQGYLGGRAMPHDKRPHEIRANDCVISVKRKIALQVLPGCDNDILELACYLEEH